MKYIVVVNRAPQEPGCMDANRELEGLYTLNGYKKLLMNRLNVLLLNHTQNRYDTIAQEIYLIEPDTNVLYDGGDHSIYYDTPHSSCNKADSQVLNNETIKFRVYNKRGRQDMTMDEIFSMLEKELNVIGEQ